MKNHSLAALCALVALALPASAKTYYVDAAAGNDANTGLSEGAAFKTIQKAIDKAAAGSTILVAPGTYAPIDSKNKSLTIKATDGAEWTFIDGAGDSSAVGAELGVYGNQRKWGTVYRTYKGGTGTKVSGLSIRGCCEAVRGGVLSFCTLSNNDNAGPDGDWEETGYVYEDSRECIVFKSRLADCVVENNAAHVIIKETAVTRCVVSGNSTKDADGGWNCILQDGTALCSLVTHNEGPFILEYCQIYNSTIVDNVVTADEAMTEYGEAYAAVSHCNVYDCIVWRNRTRSGDEANVCLAIDSKTGRLVARDFEKYSRDWNDPKEAHPVGGHFTMMNSLTDRPISQTDTKREYYYTNPSRWVKVYETYKTSKNNISADPLFIDSENGDYRLAPNSPCKDAGADYTKKTGKYDLDSGARKVGKVDMGAYELQPQTAVPADYDGDGITDAAFYFAASGQWWIFPSGDPGTVRTHSLPDRNGVPCPAAYDGGAAEPAYFTAVAKEPEFVRVKADGTVVRETFGAKGATPVAAKLDGAKATFGVYTANAKKPEFSFLDNPLTRTFGAKASRPVVADFDADGKDDLGVYTATASKPAFSILQSSQDYATTKLFNGGPVALGAKGAIPCCANFDGNGGADFGVYMSNTKAPYFSRLFSSAKFRETRTLPMGSKGDVPVVGVYEEGKPAAPAVWTGSKWSYLGSDWDEAVLLGE